jgi:hypothetical protein
MTIIDWLNRASASLWIDCTRDLYLLVCVLYYSQFNDESTMKEKKRERKRETISSLVLHAVCFFSVINFKLNYTLYSLYVQRWTYIYSALTCYFCCSLLNCVFFSIYFLMLLYWRLIMMGVGGSSGNRLGQLDVSKQAGAEFVFDCCLIPIDCRTKCPIEKKYFFIKSLILLNDVQVITLCEYIYIYLFTNWTCNVWWFHSLS